MKSIGSLLEAYLGSTYRFRESGRAVELRIGVRSENLATFHAARSVQSSALITAWNPRSEPLPEAENQRRNARLEADVRALGLDCVPAEGREGDWKELGFLVPGISLAVARDLARKHEQNAFVFATEAATPQLILTGLAADP